MKLRIIKKEERYYPQFYHYSWIIFFNKWKYFKEVEIGSFNPPEADHYVEKSFDNIESAKIFLNEIAKPSIEIVYEK